MVFQTLFMITVKLLSKIMSKTLIAFLFLASCAQKSDVTVKNRLYQPTVLILAPNTKVETIDGVYQSNPTSKELWFSAEKVEKLEKQLSSF